MPAKGPDHHDSARPAGERASDGANANTGFDLGQRIGSGRWLAKLAVLGLLISLAVGLGLVTTAHQITGLDQTRLAAAPHPPLASAANVAAATSVNPPSFAEAATADADQRGAELAAEIKADVRAFTIARGDTLIDRVTDLGVPPGESYRAIQALGRLYDPRKLRIGQRVRATLIASDEKRPTLQKLALETDPERTIVVQREGDGYRALEHRHPLEARRQYARGTISDSLYLSARRAGIPEAVLIEIIRMFSFDVDFQREIRAGDGFEALYERLVDRGGKTVKTGRVLYAALTLRGRPIRLYRYVPKDGAADYFDPQGHSARKLLMRTPIDGARLTSRYGLRKNPVLGYTLMHRGLDFGARRGTPIMAAGDGVVEKAQRYGSYGKYVRIRHNSRYKTAYAHLSAFARGIRKGRRVKQGQVIGYVGATGRATGPNLHYEVLVNGKQINPLTLKLPTGRHLEGEVLADFQRHVAAINTEIARQSSTLLAEAKCQAIPGPVRIC